MTNYVKSQDKITIILGDCTDEISKHETVCILNKKGIFTSLWTYLSDKYERGGYNNSDEGYAQYNLHYTKIEIISNDKSHTIEGSFTYEDEDLYLDNKNISKFFKKFLGQQVYLNIDMAENKDTLQVCAQKSVLDQNLINTHKKKKTVKI